MTAAVALMPTSIFHDVGGFPEALPLDYNDVDLSLRARAAGHRIVWTPHSLWYHFESRTRVGKVLPAETAYIEQRWAHELRNNPYYNPQQSPLWFDWLEVAPRRADLRRPQARLGPTRGRPRWVAPSAEAAMPADADESLPRRSPNRRWWWS